MNRLRSAPSDKVREIGSLSNPGSIPSDEPVGIEKNARIRTSTARSPERELRRKVDDLADARWLRDQVQEWEDYGGKGLLCLKADRYAITRADPVYIQEPLSVYWS